MRGKPDARPACVEGKRRAKTSALSVNKIDVLPRICSTEHYASRSATERAESPWRSASCRKARGFRPAGAHRLSARRLGTTTASATRSGVVREPIDAGGWPQGSQASADASGENGGMASYCSRAAPTSRRSLQFATGHGFLRATIRVMYNPRAPDQNHAEADRREPLNSYLGILLVGGFISFFVIATGTRRIRDILPKRKLNPASG